MKLTVDGVTYDFDPSNLRNDEAMAIERATGGSYKAWADNLKDGSALALTGLVWILQRRENPALRFDDVRFPLGSVVVEDEPEAGQGPTQPAESPSPTAG